MYVYIHIYHIQINAYVSVHIYVVSMCLLICLFLGSDQNYVCEVSNRNIQGILISPEDDFSKKYICSKGFTNFPIKHLKQSPSFSFCFCFPNYKLLETTFQLFFMLIINVAAY